MKTEYQFLHFVKVEQKPKTMVWSCQAHHGNDELGIIKWFASWRQYCYFPSVQSVYSTGCLKDIADFIDQLKETL
jgi:hypothetical protein